MGYVYKGKPSKCGTRRGYQLHLQRKELACERCLIAHAEYALEWRKKQPGWRGYAKAKCGTPGGARAHYRRGETPCQPCKDALNEYRRALTAKKKAA